MAHEQAFVTQPKRAADLLGSVMKSVQTKSSRAVFVRALNAELEADDAAMCKVLSFRKGVLHVEVASAPLFAELSSFRRESLRMAMNQRLDGHQIAKIVFRMDGTGHV